MASKSTKKDAATAPVAAEEQLSPPTTQTEAVVVAEDDDEGYGEFANVGFQNQQKGEFVIPWYTLLQDNSPVVKKQEIADARGGDFLNTVTKEIIKGKEGLLIQPVHVERVWVEWADRDSGKGIQGRHDYLSAEVQDAIRHNNGSEISTKEKPLKLGENFLVDTRYLYFNRLSEDGERVTGFGIIPFSKTKISPFVKMTSSINYAGLSAPLFAARVRLFSGLDQRKGTQDFYSNVRFEPFGGKLFDKTTLIRRSSQVFKDGVKLFEKITGGVLKADFDMEDKVHGNEAEDESSKEKRHF